MIKPYNETDPAHEKYLEEFYLLVFGKPADKLPERLLCSEWREVGFQTKNPRTDFRGSGIMGLHCLRYFVSKYPELFKQMVSTGSEYFFISLSSINITVSALQADSLKHFMIAYFYLNKEGVSEEMLRFRAGRREFKNFCALISENKRGFYEVHCFAFRFLYMLWQKEAQKNSDQFPAFSIIMQETRLFVQRLMQEKCLEVSDIREKAFTIITNYIDTRRF